jgi:N-acetyl-anhydromuramoyl-L-alanine amidase
MAIVQGWLSFATRCPSPHFDQRPAAAVVDLLIVHSISLPRGVFHTPYVHDLFLGQLAVNAHPELALLASLKVSAHVLIDRDGVVTQFVSFDHRAWHAGVSEFQGRKKCNDFSIGIELEGADDIPYEDVQYAALNDIIRLLDEHYPIKHVVGHCDVAPGRKTDPGAAFDWAKLRKKR